MATIHDALPAVNDFISVGDENLLIVAVDEDEAIWTCINQNGEKIQMWHFDENGHSGIVHMSNIRWDMLANSTESEDSEC